jgi:YidC/Oxa1 family membrane protein insertase
MNTQKRLLIAIVLSFIILGLFQRIEYTKRANNIKPVQQQIIADKTATKPFEREEIKAETKVVDQKTNTISNEIIELEISSIGAGISGLKIKDEKEGLVNLVRNAEPPFALGFDFAGSESWSLKSLNGKTIVAELENNTYRIKRTISLSENNIVVINKIKNVSNRVLRQDIEQSWYKGLGTTKDLQKENYADNRPVIKIDDKVRTNIGKGDYSGSIDWTGVVNRYFLAVFIDVDKIFKNVSIERDKKRARGCAAAGGDGNYPEIVLKGEINLNPGEEIEFEQKLYSGLKEYSDLKKLGNGLDGILSFGIFGFISKIFLNILLFFNNVFNNYGVAIILLTVVLQIFISPLTVKSFKSMNAMKQIQPKINDLRAKFKDDPARMNQEMMGLYKRHKVNPMSGCLPLLMQMPIFISLFNMLRSATELRYASFLWLSDLSKADVLFSTIPVIKSIPIIGGGGPLPFLMGGAMFLQQKLTGGVEGPQKGLTYMMPIMFTFLFMKFPAGLVLYWLSNSILTFFVQLVLSKKLKQAT